MKLSICIPVYNGAKTIARLIAKVVQSLPEYELEFVLVNDGSKDNSHEVCLDLVEKYSNLKYIELRRNYGEHNAVMCALNHTTGDYAVIMDDDFQNPPSEIIKMVEEAQSESYDVVYSKYKKKKHHFFRNLGSRFNDVVATLLLKKPNELYLSSFKVISKELIAEVIKYKGPFPYIDGLILRATDNISTVYVQHDSRQEGDSNYTLGKLINLWLNMFINFSIVPIRFISMLGIITSVISLFLAIYFLVERITSNSIPSGWASMVVLLLFLGGVQTFSLGVIGEYIGKNYLDNNATPQWTIKSYSIKTEE